jgi:hypothetical protein
VNTSVTVTAVDNQGHTLTGYVGRVHFSSSDAAGILPADYTFSQQDAGTHVFVVSLNTPGPRTVTVTDVASDTPPATVSILVGVSLADGWNTPDIPLAGTGIDSASSLITTLNAQLGSGAVSAVATYRNGAYSIYIPGYGGDQSLQPQQGVFVLSSVAGLWIPQGQPFTAPMPIALSHGWNLVAAPYPYRGEQASAISQQVTGCQLQEVVVYRGGGYQAWVPSEPDLAVPATSSVWLRCAQPGSWTPS